MCKKVGIKAFVFLAAVIIFSISIISCDEQDNEYNESNEQSKVYQSEGPASLIGDGYVLDGEGTLRIMDEDAMKLIDADASEDANSWRARSSDVKNIIIEDGVECIPDGAFKLCESVESVTLAESVKSIGDSAFLGCEHLQTIDFPDGITSIGNSAFKNCQQLTSVQLPDSVKYLGDHAFACCYKLSKVQLGESIEQICAGVFEYCNSLKRITIPDSVTSIEASAFKDCLKLEDVIMSQNVKKLGKSAFSGCGVLFSISIPDSVQTIEDAAFFGCKWLTEISIPAKLAKIGWDAFGECRNITKVYISDISSWYSMDFESIHSQPLSYGAELYLNGEILTDLVVPEGITEIKAYSFCGCKSIKTVTLPSSITAIGISAFEDCNWIDVNVADISTWCGISFADDSLKGLLRVNGEGLNKVFIPEGVTAINAYAFNWQSLWSIVIPVSVTYIGEYAFSSSDLSTIYYEGTEEQWDKIQKEQDWNANTRGFSVVLEATGYEKF